MDADRIRGTVEHIIFRNDENGYTVFTLSHDGEEETCVGVFAGITEGAVIEASGSYRTHAAYGRQFHIAEYRVLEPEGADAIERYLGSGAIRGIGRALAARIVKMFGGDSLRILTEEPERLAEVRGISMKMARSIGTQAAEQAGMRRAVIFLGQYGIPLKTGMRIYRTYGEDMYSVMSENPYRLADDIEGIGFLTADRIAEQMGIGLSSEYRLRSGILYVLAQAGGEGSVYLPETELITRASALLGVGNGMLEHALSGLQIDRRAVLRDTKDGSAVYTAAAYNTELGAARMLLDLREAARPEGAAEEKIRELEKKTGVTLEEEQRSALLHASGSGVFILTGGPGTGKTTTINSMIRYFRSEGERVLLAAPTGRAARRMTETTGYEASTIHRLLEISSAADDDPARVRFERNAGNPLEADVVIIDEMSMVDIYLLHSLLLALSPGTRLILVGDVDQLPSVGPGAVLGDMLRSDAFPSVRLTRIFRQASSSDIVVNAHRINRGEAIQTDNRSREFFFLERSDINLIISNIIELVRDKLPRYVKAEPFDIQVLTPMRKGPLGVERLNTILQEYLNPPGGGKAEKRDGDRLFRTGDKVMQIRNNYQLEWEIRGKYDIPVETGSGVFNGDLGVVRRIDEYLGLMTVEFDERRIVEYPFGSLEDLELAYAVTIHKSQGSEYPAVILPILTGPKRLLTRNLLYTAVTRARKCVILLGSVHTVSGMIANETGKTRYTSLDLRIRELAESGF